MSTGPREREIEGHGVQLTLLPTSKANDVMGTLAEAVGPALLEGGAKGNLGVAAGLLANVRGPKLNALAKELLYACRMDGELLFNNGKPAAYETAFQGKLPLLYRVMGWAIEENFGGFTELLTDIMALFQGLAVPGAAASQDAGSTFNGTGPPGESSAPASALS